MLPENYHREYYKKNKDHILQTMKVIIECECGSKVQKSKYVRHQQTKRHLNYMNQKENLKNYVEAIDKINEFIDEIPFDCKTVIKNLNKMSTR